MSSDRNTTRSLKPAAASNKATKTPLTPRLAASNAPTTSSTTTPTLRPAAPRLPSTRTPIISPRSKVQDEATARDTAAGSGITPRSVARTSRAGSTHGSPAQEESAMESKQKTFLGPADAISARDNVVSGLGIGSIAGLSNRTRATRPGSAATDSSPSFHPGTRSPSLVDAGPSSANSGIGSRFFHASDVRRQEPAPKRPEPKKAALFFHADGKQDDPSTSIPRARSPVLSAVSDNRSGAPWIRSEGPMSSSKSPPSLSPSFVPATVASSFFASMPASQGPIRSPSPSKENVHLSYRKGASQIFGMRPAAAAAAVLPPPYEESSRPSLGPPHHKSPSLSSIDSGHSHQSRRRSATFVDTIAPTTPSLQDPDVATLPHVRSPPADLPSIDTSLASPAVIGSPIQPMLSPTKNAADLAADARRERKLQDLEISNSSLLAINATLEREVRRQRAELKRFRRLSRAGRLSVATTEISERALDGLGTLEEGEDDRESNDLDPFSRTFDEDNGSGSEDDGSTLSGSEPLSPDADGSHVHDQLDRDEKRLRVDLERHKELLKQSQAMNQSIKRCMYATEDMIRDGRKALEYHVRVSDVKLGGRILTGHEDDDIEVDDDAAGDIESARDVLHTWSGLGGLEDSEGSADRDSGIEVDKPLANAMPTHLPAISKQNEDTARPEEGDVALQHFVPSGSTTTQNEGPANVPQTRET